jgi:Protein of unknown function (DUF2786)
MTDRDNVFDNDVFDNNVFDRDVLDVDRKVLDRVRKLLAKAEHPHTPPAEAEAFSAKAAALMARHAIARAVLDSDRAAASDGRATARPSTRTVAVHPPYVLACAMLLARVAEAGRVMVAIGPDRADGARICTLVGFDLDLDLTEVLFTSLLLQASTAMIAASAGHPRPRAFRRAFLLGYAASIGERLRAVARDETAAATAGVPSAAVVLADRDHAVAAAFQERFPRLRTLRTTTSSPGGHALGREAGRRADLSAARSRVAPPDRRALGGGGR